MKDCRLTVTVRDEVVHFEGEEISVEELAIHLAAMETIEEQYREED